MVVDSLAKRRYNYHIGSNCYTGDGRGGWALFSGVDNLLITFDNGFGDSAPRHARLTVDNPVDNLIHRVIHIVVYEQKPG